MPDQLLDDAKNKMGHTIEHLGREFGGVRTGRASVGLLDGITVDYYGTETPLNQAASISTPDGMTIAIQPWEASLVPAIEKAILASDLGLTPSNDGKLIRIGIPTLTEERRHELTRHVKKLAEDAKIALRNVRRDTIEKIKKKEKNKEMSEDDSHTATDKVQKILDEKVAKVDALTADKEKEIMAR